MRLRVTALEREIIADELDSLRDYFSGEFQEAAENAGDRALVVGNDEWPHISGDTLILSPHPPVNADLVYRVGVLHPDRNRSSLAAGEARGERARIAHAVIAAATSLARRLVEAGASPDNLPPLMLANDDPGERMTISWHRATV